jgi:hypothetical protein
VGDKTQGGSKKNFGEKKIENDWWKDKKERKENQKDLITYVDKPTLSLRVRGTWG